MDYYPYGDIRLDEKAGSFSEQRKYAGHEYDADTQLSYMNARYYDSGIGRFVSLDPAYLAVGDNAKLKALTKLELPQLLSDPQLLNSYSYGRNNPLVFRDPDGNFIQAVGIAAFMAFATYAPQITSFLQSLATPIGQYGLYQASQDAQKGNYGVAMFGALTAGEVSAGKMVKIGDTVRDASKPIWTLGRYGDAIKNAYYGHWAKHQSEFPEFRNAKEYVEGTYNFIKNSPEGALSGFRKNGDKLVYEVKNNILGIMDKSGVPKTMFKPDTAIHGLKTNLDYFYAELKK
jgi:RHS repeat-associated protein